MDCSEVDRFISKFKLLWQLGHEANLDLDTKAGQVWVGLRVHLGHAPGPLYKEVLEEVLVLDELLQGKNNNKIKK